MNVHDCFKNGKVDVKGLSGHLDALDSTARVREARSLSGREQAALFEAAKGFRPLTIEDFVSRKTKPMQQVIHCGRNSMPLFSTFEKRFCRPDAADKTDELWGYNEQMMKTFTGPGYFITRQADAGEVVIDYFSVPPRAPEGWPEILPNSARLSRFVYYQTRDYMRGVSGHVSIGRATRNGKPMDNWFVLCRQDP